MKFKDIMNYEVDKKDKGSIQTRAIRWLVIFLIIMFLLTIISRAADSITLNRVTTAEAKGMAISHDIEADGTVSSVKDLSVTVPAGIRVETVKTEEGKIVQEGDTLMELNMDDVSKQLKEANKEVKSAQQAITDAENAKKQAAADAAKAKSENARARQQAYDDYNSTVASAKQSLNSALKKMNAAKKIYLKYKNKKNKKGSVDTSVEDSLKKTLKEKKAALTKAQEELQTFEETLVYQAQKKIEESGVTDTEQQSSIKSSIVNSAENKKKRSELNQKISDAQDAVDEAQTALDTYESQKAELQKQSYKQKLKTLKEDYENYKEEYESALDTYNAQVKEAKNTLNDTLSSISDSSETSDDVSDGSLTADLALDETDEEGSVDDVSTEAELKEDLETKQKAADAIKAIKKADGKVVSPYGGLVTKVNVSADDVSSEDPAMRISDQSAGYTFTATLEKESAQYLSRGDKVELAFSNGVDVKGLKITSIEADTDNAGSYEILVNIPSKVTRLSTFATLKTDKDSEQYGTCVPLECLRSDGTEYYVYTVTESKSVLGIEEKVQKVSVEVLDKNSEYAAIDGEFAYDTLFVKTSSKTLNDGDRVRILDSDSASSSDAVDAEYDDEAGGEE